MKIPSIVLSFIFSLLAFGQSGSIGTAPNLASLTNRPPSAINPVVMTQGRITPGDGKGGMFTWVPSSTATIDWTNVVGSSLTSTGRWLLSLPSPTPEVSDSSKVDRVGGTGTGLDLTDTDLLGTTRVNGVNLETSLAAKISGSAAAGMFPVGTGGLTLASSGIPTNALQNINRVMLTSAELVAENPTNLTATTGGTLIFATTTGDTVAGAGARHWRWNSSSTAATNFANAGGPLAYIGSPATGRWEETVPASGAYRRVIVMSPLYPDPPGGTNANDPTSYINGLYAAAEAAYDENLGRVAVEHAVGTFTVNELIITGKVIYQAPNGGDCHFKKRSDPSGGTLNRSIATTRRLGFCYLDATDDSFLRWGDAGGTNDYYAVADNWYGLSDDISFVGNGGKIIFDQNGKICALPLLRLFEVRNFFCGPGVIEVWHNDAVNPPPAGGASNNWAINLGGRNITWFYPVIRGGTRTYQDGLHIGHGRDINIYGGYSQSGDDSLVCENEAAGAFTNPPDEPLENVYVGGWHAESTRGRAAIIATGPNWVNATYTNRTPQFRNITIDGVTGKSAVQRSFGLGIGAFQDGSGIWTYTITNPGSGYTNGYYNIGVGAVGGGSGALCTVKVAGGQVTRAVMAKVSGVWQMGSGYRQDQAATVASIPGGSGALITAVVSGLSNDDVVNCTIKNFALDMGSTTHDGIEAYAIKLSGAKESVIGPGFIKVTDNTANPSYPATAFRPYYVQSASNCVIRGVYVSETYRGGGIVANDFPKCYVTGMTFDECVFGPFSNTAHGICKINGDTVGRVTWLNSTLKIKSNTVGFYLTDLENTRVCYADLLEVIGCTIMADTGAVNTWPVYFVSGGGSGNMLGKLKFLGNTLVNLTSANTAATIQAGATEYEIDGNSGGYRTKLGTVVTQLSGTTQVSATVGTVTGLISNTTAALPSVRVIPLGNPGSNWWIEPSTTGAFLIKTASAVGADLAWAVYVDTSRKPLTGY